MTWLLENWLTIVVVGLGIMSIMSALLVSAALVWRKSDED